MLKLYITFILFAEIYDYLERKRLNGFWSDFFFHMIYLCYLTGTATHSTSVLRWSTVTTKK